MYIQSNEIILIFDNQGLFLFECERASSSAVSGQQELSLQLRGRQGVLPWTIRIVSLMLDQSNNLGRPIYHQPSPNQ